MEGTSCQRKKWRVGWRDEVVLGVQNFTGVFLPLEFIDHITVFMIILTCSIVLSIKGSHWLSQFIALFTEKIWHLRPFWPLKLAATLNGSSHCKSPVIVVLFPLKKQKFCRSRRCSGPYVMLVSARFSHCIAADIAGSARAAPSLVPSGLCWIWWSGWSAWTGPTWCSDSVTMPASGGSEIYSAVGSSWRRRRPCWRPKGAWGPGRLWAARWDPPSESAPQSLWPGWTRWATAGEGRQGSN